MNLQPLSTVRSKVSIGRPLLFSIRDGEGRLLLRSGHVIADDDQLATLLDRGAFVEMGEVQAQSPDTAALVRRAKRADLPGLWTDGLNEASRLLRHSTAADFSASLERAYALIVALIERDPDLAIFQIVRQEGTPGAAAYASRHSVHAATAVHMAGTRLGWDAATVTCAFRAALTMNIAMVELQNTLSTQVTPVTPLQREAIRSHPQRGVEMLTANGVTDPTWLRVVAQHHETQDGKGYPEGRTDIDPIALLLQRADVFTAKFSPRHGRASLHSDVAARRQYQHDQGNPMSAALIKEFGLYPPGTTVRLKSGECGIVLRRSEAATAPLTVALADASGTQLSRPRCRDTRQPEYAIAAAVLSSTLKVRISQEQLAVIAEA